MKPEFDPVLKPVLLDLDIVTRPSGGNAVDPDPDEPPIDDWGDKDPFG